MLPIMNTKEASKNTVTRDTKPSTKIKPAVIRTTQPNIFGRKIVLKKTPSGQVFLTKLFLKIALKQGKIDHEPLLVKNSFLKDCCIGEKILGNIIVR